MIRVYLPYVTNVIESLNDLAKITGGETLGTHRYVLWSGHNNVHGFLFSSVWSGGLRVCLGPGSKLLEAIQDISKGESDDVEVDFLQAFTLSNAISSFRTVLEAEFQTSSLYLVTARRGFDIPSLLEQAEIIFPPELMNKLPGTRFDLRQAGKCIAFDLGTGAGFHLLRALETVICAYWNVVMKGAPLPENRNIGAYIREMETAKVGDGKVLTALRQIKDFHRNSLMHPEETLDLDQAIALLGIVQSAIVAMLPIIPPPALELVPLDAT